MIRLTLVCGTGAAVLGITGYLIAQQSAPVKVGAGAITGAGSVITKDVAPDALAVARGAQTEKPGWAKLFRDLKRKKRDQA